MTGPVTTAGEPPVLGVSRLALVITGSVPATGMPFWLSWLRESYPRLEITTVVTRSAKRFVTQQALEVRVPGEVMTDTWPEHESRARHVELWEWADAMVVYPATLHFTARLALGLADSPALLAAQCMTAPIAVAPALPPGGLDSPAVEAHWAALAARRNVVMVPPAPGLSATTGRDEVWVPPPLPDVLRRLEQRRAELASSTVDERGHGLALLADGTRV